MKVADVGGDLLYIEPMMIEESSHKTLILYMLKEGGFIPLMEALNGFDENYSQLFFNSREDRKVTVNGITFQILVEIISLVMGLVMKGRKLQKVTRVVDETSLNRFFLEGEKPIRHRKVFLREKLPDPWNVVCLVLMNYLTLEGRYGVCYYV